MLKGIPEIISPELLKIMYEMGHGDEIIIADANFPAITLGKRIIRYDGVKILPLLDAMMEFFPLDRMVEYPVVLMETVSKDESTPPIWAEYQKIIEKYKQVNNYKELKDFNYVEFMERFSFYDRAKDAYAIIITSDFAAYGNIILKKDMFRTPPAEVK